MLRTVHLHGRLRDQFDPTYELDVKTPAEAVRALLHMVPGLEQAIREGAFRVIAGRKKDGRRLSAEDLTQPFRGNREADLHIVPAVRGAGGGSGTKILVGIALIAVAIAAPYALGAVAGLTTATGAAITTSTGLGAALSASMIGVSGVATFGSLAMLGAMVALGGVVMAMSPQQKANYNNREVDRSESFIYNGPVNTVEQGGPVALIYGEMTVGSKVISAGVKPEDLPVDAQPNTSLNVILRSST
jgi:predicted phage tail protein